MLNEDERAAWLQHTHHFGKCPTLVSDATQNQGADHAINRRRLDRQILRRTAQNVNPQPHTPGLFGHVPIHVGVRLYTYPTDLFPCEISEVCSGARADLQDRAANVRKQFGLVRCQVAVRLMAEPRHKPRENAQPDGAGTATDARRIALSEFSIQCIDYYATEGHPP